MAPEWEAMGVDLGIGVNSTNMPPPAPSHFYGGDVSFFPPAGGGAQGALASGSSSFNLSFANDFSIPSEEAAELEWLSNFIDDSYPDMPNYPPEVAQAHQQINNKHKPSSSSSSSSQLGLGGGGGSSSTGARTKRSRATSSSWLSSPSSSSSAARGGGDESDGALRRCTHCASDKTPQWRTGPLGPKTLCNACGVRYKSGRLVPEYRPAASPTFVLTQHSNSHRKVMELRRQKELVHLHGGAPSSSSSAPFRDYGVC